SRLDGLDAKFRPGLRRRAIERPVGHVAGEAIELGSGKHVHRADPPPAVDAQIDLLAHSGNAAAHIFVLQALQLRVENQVDIALDDALRQQVGAAEGDAYGERDEERVPHRHPEGRSIEQPAPAARLLHSSSSCSTYPEPRTVWMRSRCAPRSIAWRSRLMCTSTRLLCGSKCRSQTPSSNMVRVTTCPSRRMRNSSSFCSRAVSSISCPPRVTLRASRSNSRSATRSTVDSAALGRRRSRASMRASSSANAKGLVR